MKLHIRDIRLHNNAGMSFPVCYVNSGPLDLDKSRLSTATRPEEATCRRCLSTYKKRYPWVGRN